MINEKTIKNLYPCKESFDKALKFYKGKSFTKRQFMGLKNVTHNDKLWVAFKLMPKKNLRFAATDIAELVLPIYENEYPGDLRPRKAIEAVRKLKLDSADASAYATACAFAHAAYAEATWPAAKAAAQAAYNAAYVWKDDCISASTAFTYIAATGAVAPTYDNRNKIEKQIRTVILKYWK